MLQLLSSTHPQSVTGCPFQLSSQLPWISYPPTLLGEGEAALCKHHGAVSGGHGKRFGASGIGVGWGSRISSRPFLSGPWGCVATGRSWNCPLPGTDHELGPWRLVLATAHWELFDRRRDCSGKVRPAALCLGIIVWKLQAGEQVLRTQPGVLQASRCYKQAGHSSGMAESCLSSLPPHPSRFQVTSPFVCLAICLRPARCLALLLKQ